MAYPPHAPPPEDQRPSWYTPAPEPTGPPQPPAPEPGHARRPGDPYAGPFESYASAPAAPPASDRKPHSPALATVGWVLTVLFGLLFLVLFFAGVDAFNSNVTAGENAYNFGLFLGFFLILLIPAIPILLGIRLIRQPRRQPRIR